MFKKLRIQFISVVMASVAIVLAIVFSGICISEYQRVTSDVNQAMNNSINRTIEAAERQQASASDSWGSWKSNADS